MRWKSVLFAAVIWPVGTGCNIAYNTARNAINEPHVSLTKHSIRLELRKAARAAFEEIRGNYPEHADSEDFRDGFIDGYVDFLDKGGNGSLPAVPPAKYTRHPKYFTENGQCLIKSYFLGFKYGQEVAIATGRRQFLTVPVLLPQEPTGPPAFDIQKPADAVPTMPIPRPPGQASLTGLERRAGGVAVPQVRTTPPALLNPRLVARGIAKEPPPPEFDPLLKPMDDGGKKGPPPPEFNPAPMAEPERIAIPSPLLPLPATSGPAGPAEWGNLPSIPTAPAGPTVPSLPPVVKPDEPLPRVLPPNRIVVPPLPPNHPQPRH